MRRQLTEAQRRHDWPTQKREQGKSDGAGPDMWPTGDQGKRRRVTTARSQRQRARAKDLARSGDVSTYAKSGLGWNKNGR